VVDDSQATQTAKRRDRLGHLRAALEELKCGHLFAAVVEDLRAEGAQLGLRVRQPGEAWTGRPTKYTPELTRQIAAYVRAGGYPWAAAQACGIHPRTLTRWLTRGEQARRGMFFEFCLAVRKAEAEARMSAEARVFAEQPALWLTKGPGRSIPGREGWTEQYDININPREPLHIVIEYVHQKAIPERTLEAIVHGEDHRDGDGATPDAP
jgi:hypothetical protein